DGRSRAAAVPAATNPRKCLRSISIRSFYGCAARRFGGTCASVSVWPATVIVPLRGRPFGSAATEYVTLPLPLPLPAVMVIQLLPLVAVQAQPLSLKTLTLPDAAPATLASVAESV